MKQTLLFLAFFCTVFVCRAQDENLFPEVKYLRKYMSKYPLDKAPKVRADARLIAIWKMEEDEDPHNYFVVQRYDTRSFAFTYMNRCGSNRTYENVPAYFSKVGGATFVNIGFRDPETNEQGYLLVRVTGLDDGGWNMKLSLVADKTLKNISSPAELRKRVTENLNNPKFYKRTVHFHKKLPLMYCK